MSLNNATPGPGSYAEYMVSAIPWLTASQVPGATTVGHSFQYVASTFSVRNKMTGSVDQLAVGFTLAGVAGANRVVLGAGESFTADFRFKDLYLRAINASAVDYELVVGLTTIPSTMFPILTGSGLG